MTRSAAEMNPESSGLVWTASRLTGSRGSEGSAAAGLLVEALVLGTVVAPAFPLRLLDEALGDGPAEHAHVGARGDLDRDDVVLLVDVLQGPEDPARGHHLVADLQALEEGLLLALTRAVGPKEQEVEDPTEEDQGKQQAEERAARG